MAELDCAMTDMSRRERSAITEHLTRLQSVADALRLTAEQMRKGELNRWHAANKVATLADRIAVKG